MAFQKSPTEGNVPTHTADTREANTHSFSYCFVDGNGKASSQTSATQYPDSCASTLFIEGLEDALALGREERVALEQRVNVLEDKWEKLVELEKRNGVLRLRVDTMESVFKNVIELVFKKHIGEDQVATSLAGHYQRLVGGEMVNPSEQ